MTHFFYITVQTNPQYFDELRLFFSEYREKINEVPSKKNREQI